MNSTCPLWSFSLADSAVNQQARSISGKLWNLPDFGGHSISKVLLTMDSGSELPSTAHK